MLHIEYKLSLENQIVWKSICKNIYKNMKIYYKHNIHSSRILSLIRKKYKITPARLRTDKSKSISVILDYTLYLLLEYSTASFQNIINEFENINLKKLQAIQDNKMLFIRYRQDEIIFLNNFKDDYLSDKYQSLVIQEQIGKFINSSIQT